VAAGGRSCADGIVAAVEEQALAGGVAVCYVLPPREKEGMPALSGIRQRRGVAKMLRCRQARHARRVAAGRLL